MMRRLLFLAFVTTAPAGPACAQHATIYRLHPSPLWQRSLGRDVQVAQVGPLPSPVSIIDRRGREVRLPLSELLGVDTLAGTRHAPRPLLPGIAAGVFYGGLAGLTLGIFAGDQGDQVLWLGSMAGRGALVGALIGGVSRASHHEQIWVPLPPGPGPVAESAAVPIAALLARPSRPGYRVALRSDPQLRLPAYSVVARDDSIHVDFVQRPAASLPRRDVARAWRYAGERGHGAGAWRGFLRGAIAGTVVGGIIMEIAASSGPTDGWGNSEDWVPAGAAVLGGIGGSIGLLVGATTRPERWEEVTP